VVYGREGKRYPFLPGDIRFFSFSFCFFFLSSSSSSFFLRLYEDCPRARTKHKMRIEYRSRAADIQYDLLIPANLSFLFRS